MQKMLQGQAYGFYDSMLNEVVEPVKIGSLTYSPSYVLKMVDPVAYRLGFWEWADSEKVDIS